MKELERLEVIKRVIEDIYNNEYLNRKNDELSKLSKSERKKQYMILKDELEAIKTSQAILGTTKESMIETEFFWSLYSGVREETFSPCKHDIWIYAGSYGNDFEFECYDEEDEDFSYNSYTCLECGETVNE